MREPTDMATLARSIKDWGAELGFQQVGIAGIGLSDDLAHLRDCPYKKCDAISGVINYAPTNPFSILHFQFSIK